MCWRSVSAVLHTGVHAGNDLLYYVINHVAAVYFVQLILMCISVYLGEIEFSIISALKSQISPGIDFNYLMHSKVGSHFSFSLAHVCHIFCVVLIVGTFCVGRCTRIQQQSNNMNTQFVATSLLMPWQIVAVVCRCRIVLVCVFE